MWFEGQRIHFPRAERILDFWHASESLVELGSLVESGQSLFVDDDELRTKRVGQWCHQLKQEGGLRIVRLLEELDMSEYSSAQRAAHADCLRYIQNHQHKMDYPRYVKNGWQIGSGPVEMRV